MTNNSLPNIPWQERPADCSDVVWRYDANPIIPRNLIPSSNSIFNSAVVPFKGKFAGVFRCDNKKREMNLNRGFSDDGIHWKLDNETIDWENDDPDINWFQYRYDPRVVWIEDRYYVTWCNGYHGPTIGIGYTYDFEKFTFLENALLPFNRNGVLFPRKINGKYVMFSRPSDNGHTPFGDIYLSQSPDMIHWGEHRFVMGAGGRGGRAALRCGEAGADPGHGARRDARRGRASSLLGGRRSRAEGSARADRGARGLVAGSLRRRDPAFGATRRARAPAVRRPRCRARLARARARRSPRR